MKAKLRIFKILFLKGLPFWGGPFLLITTCGDPQPAPPPIKAGWMLESRHLEAWKTRRNNWNLGDSNVQYLILRAPELPTSPLPDQISPEQATEPVITFLPLHTPHLLNPDSLAVARHILQYVDRSLETWQMKARELVIWYPWTTITREPYFRLLRTLQSMSKGQLQISVMVQAAAFRYQTDYGIPPVSHVWLQGSSFLPILQNQFSDDPLQQDRASRYWSQVSTYPLPVDLYLPWTPLLLACKDNRCNEYPYLDVALLQDTFLFKSTDGISFQSSYPADSLRSFQALNNHWKQGAEIAALFRQFRPQAKPRLCFAQWHPELVSHLEKPSLQAVVNYFRK